MTFNPIPRTPDEVDVNWINAALAVERHPAAGSIADCSIRPLETQGNTGWYALADIESHARGDLPKTLFLKVATEYENVVFLYAMYEREIAFYRDISPSVDARFLRMYYGAVNKEEDRGIVVLEAYDPALTLSTQNGISPQEASASIRTLTALQAAWWNRDLPPSITGSAGAFDLIFAALARLLPAPWGAHRDQLARLLPGSATESIDALLEDIQSTLAPMADWPQTILQLDCRAENIAMLENAGAQEAVIFDWQRAAPGPGPFDLASLIGTSVEPEFQHTTVGLVDQYLEDLKVRGVAAPDRDQTFEALRICSIVTLAVRIVAGRSTLNKWAECEYGTAPDNWHFKTIMRSAYLVDRLNQSL